MLVRPEDTNMKSQVETALWTIVARARNLMESKLLLDEVAPNEEMVELEEALNTLDHTLGLKPGSGL